MSDIERAIHFAVSQHAGQVDKAGDPYILHVLRVAACVPPDDPDSVIAALLHDAVEDTPLTIESVEAHFGAAVAEIVDHLTREEGESYPTYLKRVKLCSKAFLIKRIDLLDNLRFDRMVRISDETERERLRNKYIDALEELNRC